MQTEFGLVHDDHGRQGCNRLQQKGDERHRPQQAVGDLPRPEDDVRSDLPPLQEDMALIVLDHEIIEERCDEANGSHDMLTVKWIVLA